MSSVIRGVLALGCVLAALLSDWLASELFMRRDSVLNIAAAITIDAALVLGLIALARRLLSDTAFKTALHTAVLVGMAAVVLSGVRAAVPPGASMGVPVRLAIAALAVGSAWLLVRRLRDETSARLMRAVALSCVVFVALPFVWRSIGAAPRVWIGPVDPAAHGARATIFLLFDEMGAMAARPIADDLRAAGLNVREDALAAAGENTMNVIPALFSGLEFGRARPCGIATLCSGTHALDFSRITVQRDDVDVTGLLVPYCDIRGLRSCFDLPLPHEFGSAYRSLAIFHLRRLGLPPPSWLEPLPAPPDLKATLLRQQLSAIDRSRVWTDGGILYAHLPLPHPPGLESTGSLDDEYASNIERSRALVREWVARASARFGGAFSIIVTSDHPLRDYWCTSGAYRGDACRLREAFRSTQVPLIVASPGAVSTRPVSNNRDVFGILNDQAGTVPTKPGTGAVAVSR